MLLESKKILVTGGTGSMGKTLVRRILGGELGTPARSRRVLRSRCRWRRWLDMLGANRCWGLDLRGGIHNWNRSSLRTPMGR
jgi:UDP-glucose 4-epimerase